MEKIINRQLFFCGIKTINAIFLMVLLSCQTKKTNVIFESECNHSNLQFYATPRSVMEPNLTQLFLKFGKLPPIAFANSSQSYFVNHHQNIPNENIVVLRPLLDTTPTAKALFVDEKDFSKLDFNQLSECLKKEYSNIATHFANIGDSDESIRRHQNAFDIDAIIYGSAETYASAYRSVDSGRLLLILPNGHCNLYELKADEKIALPNTPYFYGANRNPENNTITQIYLDDSVGAQEMLKGFINVKSKRLLQDDFTIVLEKYEQK